MSCRTAALAPRCATTAALSFTLRGRAHRAARRILRALLLAAGIWLAGLLATVAARAAEADTAAAAPGQDAVEAPDPALQPVVVQARRRTERLFDAPVAVTVESGRELQEQDAVLFDDIARLVPNLRMVQSPQSVSALDVTMRGQTAIRSAIAFDPAIGIYVDGVYVANGQAAMNTLLDIDKVEIVRGAQGTLFGRNNTGGSISFVTNRPQLHVDSAELAVDSGTFGLFQGRGVFNLALDDTVALRLAYQDNQREGYGSSVGSGQGGFGNQHRYQVRLGALWQPDPGFDAYWTYEHFDASEVGALLHPLHGTQVEQLGQLLGQVPQLSQQGVPGLVNVAPVVIPDNFYQTDADYPSHDRTQLDATQLTLTQALGATTRAKLILGYRHLGNDTAIDVDATTLPFANTNLSNASSQKSAELQLGGSARGQAVNWVGGLYWFRDDGSAPSVLQPASAAYINDFNALLPPGSLPVSPVPVIESNSLQNLSRAAFVHGEAQLSERWAAAAGLRHTNDTRRLSENSYAQTPAGPLCTILDQSTGAPANYPGPCPPIEKSVGYAYWSYEFSTRYQLSETQNAYLRIGRGQRSGGWNVPVNTLQDTPFHPEQLTDYELGLKSFLLGGALFLRGDVFYGNYDQMQRLLPRLVGGTPTTYVINAGKARVSGAEIESSMFLSRSWSVQGALGWTDARYVQFLYSPGGGNPTLDLSGNRFNETPRVNAGLGLGYQAPLGSGSLRLHADLAWQDAVQFNVINDFNSQGAYGTLNARATYAAGASTWELAAFGTNLTGRQFAINGGSVATFAPQPAISWQIPGAPRMLGVEVVYRIGNKG